MLAKLHAMDNLAVDLFNYNIDIGLVCETFFNSTHDLLSIDKYMIFRKNRIQHHGGGVAIFIKDPCRASVIQNRESEFELLWVHVEFSGFSIICGIVYHSPNLLYKYLDLLQQLEEDIVYFENHRKFDLILLGGDFNAIKQEDVIIYSGLKAVNKQPTRGKNTLDYIYTNINVWNNCYMAVACTFSDHKAIILHDDATWFDSVDHKNKNKNKNNIKTKYNVVKTVVPTGAKD